MADLHNLKIYINPTGTGAQALDAQYLSGKTTEQSIIFDEVAQIIYLAGNTYSFKTLTAEEYTNLMTAITNLGTVQSGIGDITDTGITVEDDTDITIENLLKALQTRLAAVEDDYLTSDDGLTTTMSTEVTSEATSIVNNIINGLRGEATGGASGVTGVASHIKVTVSSTGGQVSSVIVNEENIANASDLNNLSGRVTTVENTAVTQIVGKSTYTGTSIALDGTKLNVGTLTGANVANTYKNDTISVAIDALDRAITALAGSGDSSLASKIQLIDDIYAELIHDDNPDDDENDAVRGIIDALRRLKIQSDTYYGVGANGNAPNSDASIVSLQDSLENLSALIANYKTTHSLQDDTQVNASINTAIGNLAGSASGGATGATGVASHIKVTVTTSGGEVSSVAVNEIDIASASALSSLSGTVSTIQANSKTVTLSNTGTAVGTNYIKVTESSNQYTVETTQALDNAINGVVSWTVISND